MDLIKDVFEPVYQKVVEEKKELIGKQKTPTHGFEAWLTIQLKIALKETGLQPVSHKQGPDISFSNGSKLELKAAANFSLPWLIRDGALHHKAPVLFLFNGNNKNNINELKKRPEVRVLHYRYISDGIDDWILGLVVPEKKYIGIIGKQIVKGTETKKSYQRNEIIDEDYQKMGYNAGVEVSKNLSPKDRDYIKAVNRPGSRAYHKDDPQQGVSVVLDSFRKGATIQEVVKKLVIQSNQTWSKDKKKAEKYVNRMINDLNTKYFYGWLLYKIEDKYFLKETTPTELCFSKYGNPKSISDLSHDHKMKYLKGWFNGILRQL